MTEELLSQPGVCSVHWDGGTETITVEWDGDVGGEDYRDVMERVLDWIVDRDATKLLVDARKQGLMSEADQDWTVADWQPRAVEAGLTDKAIVYPEDRPARTTVDMSARKSPQPGLERLFTEDIEEARNWLGTT
ncbi:STAS/SEC14 domain-containing protein [Halorientalis pallida]|uniref:STAS/SEC14 domain-containing protein n=1 Tax=Halorientalis pallida TaxID=2479928 RepID=UPI003C6FC602